MALSIGTLVGYLQLDDTNFNRKADTADRKLSALKLHLDALKRENPKISVQVDAQTAKIDEIKAKIADLKVRAATGADVRVDITQAMIDLDRVQTKVRELHGKTIKVDVDKKSADSAVSSFSTLTTTIMALGPAIIPVTAAATGLVAALGAPIAAAAGGGGLYAFIAAKAVAQTEKQSKALDQLKKKVDAAQQSLDNASTKASRKTAAAKLAQDTAAYQQALAKVNPEQQKFLKAQDSLGKAFQGLERSAGTSVFGPMTEGMNLLAKDMPKIAPVLKSVSGALTDLIHEAANSNALGSLIKFLDAFAGPSIKSAGHILGDLAVGMGGLLKAFLPLSTSLSHGLEGMAQNFADFGRGASSNKGLQAFIAYVEQVGPKVVATLGDLVKAIVHIGIALAPIGNVSLAAIDGIAKVIDKIPPGLITSLAAAFIELSVALKAVAVASTAAASLGKLQKVLSADAIGSATSRIGALGTGIQSMTTRLAESKTALVSAGVGIAGLAVSAQSSNKWVNILGSSASGALLGFGVGGPIGAAVGAGAGALLGLGIAAFQAGNSVDEASKKVDASQAASMRASEVNQDLAIGLHLTAAGAKVAGMSMHQLAAYTNGVNNAFGRYDSMTQYRSALDNLTSSVKQNGATLNVNTQAGQANRDALSQIAQAAFAMASKMADAGRRMTFLQTARGDFIRAAEAAGDTRTQAVKLANEFHLIDLIHAQPKVVLKAGGVVKQLDEIRGIFDQIDGTHTSVLHYKTTGTPPTSLAGLLGGNYTPGGKHSARGGLIAGPGSPTSDSIPAMLSNGEYVVNAAAASRNRRLLDEINSPQGYASGGTVKPTKAEAAAERAAAERRRKQLEAELAADQKKLAHINALVAQAQQFADAFAPNAFSAGLATTKDVTKPGGVMTQLINGQVVTTRGAGTTSTVKLSNAQVLAEMNKYIKGQAKQDHQLAKNIKKLKAEGVPTSVIAQMQAAGPEGIAEINALASGTKAQVREFNHYNNLANNSLANAGAQAVAGTRRQTLKNRQQNQEDITKGVQGALKHLSVKVTGNKLRVTG